MNTDVKHGTYAGYTGGCRCAGCSAAMRRYQRAYRARTYRDPADIPRWHRPWTEEDVRTLSEGYGAVPDAELAETLGRGVQAMQRKASRLGLKGHRA